MSKRQGKDKGKLITYQSGTGIYENVLEHLKSAGNAENKILRMILKKYFPNNKGSTLDTKICVYSEYLRKLENKQGETNMEICNGKIKVDAYLHNMKAGKKIELECDGEIYVLKGHLAEERKMGKSEPTLPEKLVQTKLTAPLDKGNPVFSYGHNKGFENPLNDIRDLANKGKGTVAAARKILKLYYPKAKNSTLKAYCSTYRSYIRDSGAGKEIAFPKRKRRRRKLPGTIGYDKKYHIHVREKDIQDIKKAMAHVEYGYKPNVKTIQKVTGLTVSRVLGTIDWLRKQGQVITKRTPEKDVIYSLV